MSGGNAGSPTDGPAAAVVGWIPSWGARGYGGVRWPPGPHFRALPRRGPACRRRAHARRIRQHRRQTPEPTPNATASSVSMTSPDQPDIRGKRRGTGALGSRSLLQRRLQRRPRLLWRRRPGPDRGSPRASPAAGSCPRPGSGSRPAAAGDRSPRVGYPAPGTRQVPATTAARPPTPGPSCPTGDHRTRSGSSAAVPNR